MVVGGGGGGWWWRLAAIDRGAHVEDRAMESRRLDGYNRMLESKARRFECLNRWLEW